MWFTSYGKKRRLAELSQRARAISGVVGRSRTADCAGRWRCLPGVSGLVKGQDKSLVQKFTFALTRSGRLGNLMFHKSVPVN